jgi:hypothetical protein
VFPGGYTDAPIWFAAALSLGYPAGLPTGFIAKVTQVQNSAASIRAATVLRLEAGSTTRTTPASTFRTGPAFSTSPQEHLPFLSGTPTLSPLLTMVTPRCSKV